MRILFGPILFAMDVEPINIWTGVAFTVILLLAIALAATRPRGWTIAIAILACWLGCFLASSATGLDVEMFIMTSRRQWPNQSSAGNGAVASRLQFVGFGRAVPDMQR